MNCDELERNLDCFKTKKDVYGNTVKFNYSWSPSGTGFGQGNGFEIYSETDDGDYQTIFECYDNGTLNLGNMTLINYHDQMEVAKFLRQDPEEWFKEPLFYIVLGRGTYSGLFTAYKKIMFNQYEIVDEADINGDDRCDYVFTQDEIDDLKSKLPENMKKIVDLGKTEVNENDN